VASFMSDSLDLGTIHRGAPRHARRSVRLLGTPRDDDSPFTESPLGGEYRQSHGRTVL